MEFKLIEAIRERTARRRDDVVLGIGDDAALLDMPPDRQLVACTDTLVAGVHFLVDTAAEDIGWKSLAVNLSDLAAMGAEPAWALLALTLPEADAHFVEKFADGFAELAGVHGVALVGGDTTQGPLSVTVTVLGTTPRGEALTRRGAGAGDAVFVTGTLGDAAGALRLLREPRSGAVDPEQRQMAALLARMHRPVPRIAAGLALRGVAGSCIDVSDGLLADLGHVCAASGVGAEIDIEALPMSPALGVGFDRAACQELALTGGDDYELCFSVPENRAAEIGWRFADAGCRTTRIGRITEGLGVRVKDAQGNFIETPHAGWEHFSR
ncbi:MAG: thiamine-phosphate kinase [Rhodanobacteraceae bacterium]